MKTQMTPGLLDQFENKAIDARNLARGDGLVEPLLQAVAWCRNLQARIEELEGPVADDPADDPGDDDGEEGDDDDGTGEDPDEEEGDGTGDDETFRRDDDGDGAGGDPSDSDDDGGR